jgi:O-antigen ligase
MVYFLFFFSVQADALCLRNRRAVFLIFAACFLIVSAANFVFHAVKGFSAIIEDYPFWPGKNMFSVFLFTGLFLILGRASEIPGRAAKILLWSAVALGVFDLVLANSRAGVIAFAAGVLIWIFLMRGKKRLAGIACLVLLAALGFLSPTMRTRLLDAARMKDYNTQERAAIWKGTVDMIRHRPVLGVGAGRFSQEFFDRASDFFFKKVERKRENYHSHNLFLQIGAESGLPAAVLLMGAYLAIFINAFSLAVKGGGNLGTTCALGSFFIYSLMDCTYNARFTDASMFHVNIIMLMLLAGVFDADQFKIQNEKCKIDESDQLKMQNAK